jgi:hypothetical protein
VGEGLSHEENCRYENGRVTGSEFQMYGALGTRVILRDHVPKCYVCFSA